MTTLARPLGIALFGLGVWAASLISAELRMTPLSIAPPSALPSELIQLEGHLGDVLSIRSQRVFLESCLSLAASSLLDLQTESTRRDLAASCQDAAQTKLSAAPTWALPRLVSAWASVQAGDTDAGRDALLQAHAAAPADGWLALQRVHLVLSHGLWSDIRIAATTVDDIRLASSSFEGASALAVEYQGRPAARDFMSAALEEAPIEDQRRFLRAVLALTQNQ